MNHQDPKGYYDALGFYGDVKHVSVKDIAEAYQQRLRPDVYVRDLDKAHEAWNVLSNPKRRTKYDKSFLTPSELRAQEVTAENLLQRIARAAKRAKAKAGEAFEGLFAKKEPAPAATAVPESEVAPAKPPALANDVAAVEKDEVSATIAKGEDVVKSDAKGGKAALVTLGIVAAVGAGALVYRQLNQKQKPDASWAASVANAPQPTMVAR